MKLYDILIIRSFNKILVLISIGILSNSVFAYHFNYMVRDYNSGFNYGHIEETDGQSIEGVHYCEGHTLSRGG